jgi:hypothetical protein
LVGGAGAADDEPSDHERGQQERDDHAHADEHIGENDSGAVIDGHGARKRFAIKCLCTVSRADRPAGSCLGSADRPSKK